MLYCFLTGLIQRPQQVVMLGRYNAQGLGQHVETVTKLLVVTEGENNYSHDHLRNLTNFPIVSKLLYTVYSVEQIECK